MTFNQAIITSFSNVLTFLGKTSGSVFCVGMLGASIALIGSPAAAKSPVDDSLTICLNNAPSFAPLEAELDSAGWIPLKPASTTDQDVEKIAWFYALNHLGAVSSDATLQSTLGLQRKTVRGVLKKQDLAKFRARILKRPVGPAEDYLVLNWQNPYRNVIRLTCSFLIAGQEGEHAAFVSDLTAIVQAPKYANQQVIRTPNIELEQADIQATVFNWEKLEQKTGSRPPFAVISTFIIAGVGQ